MTLALTQGWYIYRQQRWEAVEEYEKALAAKSSRAALQELNPANISDGKGGNSSNGAFKDISVHPVDADAAFGTGRRLSRLGRESVMQSSNSRNRRSSEGRPARRREERNSMLML